MTNMIAKANHLLECYLRDCVNKYHYSYHHSSIRITCPWCLACVGDVKIWDVRDDIFTGGECVTVSHLMH